MGDEEKVTDSELDAAAEGVVEDVVEEQVADDVSRETEIVADAEIAPEAELDPRIKSALGRVTGLQSKMDRIESTLGQLVERFDKPEELDNSDGIITSEEDVMKVVEKRENQKAAARNEYTKKATNALIDIGLQHTDIGDKDYVEIHKDADKHWKAVTGDPTKDAQFNFTEALNRYYQKQINANKDPKNPLDKNKDTDAEELGGPAESEVKVKTVKIPKLDPAAEDFVKRTGMKQESVEAALTGDMPAYLGGR